MPVPNRKMIRELALNNAAYRSLTESWFRHSSAMELFRRIAESGYKAILTTDHGTVQVSNPIKVVGTRDTNTNLRYKIGRNLSYNPKQVYEIKKPERFGLPSPSIATTYIFASGRDFFAIRTTTTITYSTTPTRFNTEAYPWKKCWYRS